MNKIFMSIVILFLALGTITLLGCSMSERDDGGGSHSHSSEEIYTCPMHPQIRESKPGSCPICHMALVKVSNESSKKTMSNSQKKLDLDVSPYQAKLIGIKPTVVEEKVVVYKIPVTGRMTSRNNLALQVFEKDLRYIKSGVEFSGISEVYPEETIEGKITSVDNIADPSSRTIRVLGRVKSGANKLPAETSFSGHVFINLKKKLVVPEKSVLFTGKGSFVYTYENDTLRPQKVVLGPKIDAEYVVLEGLQEGATISSGPNFLIDSESKIRGLSTSDSAPTCPDGQKWNTSMSMCMPGDS
jgi:hypothetical protein